MAALYGGTIRIDDQKKPSTIDLTFTEGPEKGNTNAGIFEFLGDDWRICLNTRGTARPEKFETKPGTSLALEKLSSLQDLTALLPRPRPTLLKRRDKHASGAGARVGR